jgi:hypothetical protein
VVCTVATPAGSISSCVEQLHKGKHDNLSLRSTNCKILYITGTEPEMLRVVMAGTVVPPFMMSIIMKSSTNLLNIARTC